MTLVLAGIVCWASIQLTVPIGLHLMLTAGLGGVLAAVLVLARWREAQRGSRTATPDVGRPAAAMVLLLIVAGAIGLRLHTLLARPTWADEMWTLRNMYTSHWGELLRVAFDDYWPPLHYLLLNALARVGNTGLLWLRGPSLVFGVAAVALMYPLGLILFRNRLAALAGAALLAGMTSHVLYSQEARVYTMLVFLAVASAYYFYRSYWERRISAGFLVSTILLIYSHSFASWYFVSGECAYVLAAWLIWRDREAFKKGLLSQAIVLAAWTPLVGAFVYSRFAHGIVVPTQWATGLKSRPGLMDLVELYQGLAVRSWAGVAFMVLLFTLALAPLFKGRDPTLEEGRVQAKPVIFLLCWVTVPVLFSLIVTLGSSLKTFGATRYHLTVLPGLCLLAAQGFLRFKSRSAMAAGWLLVVLLPAAQLPRYYRWTRPAVDEAARIVKTDGSPEDLVYVGESFRAFAYYYRGIFPRIGSAQWDSLAASVAGLTGRYTMPVHKWGNTYAYEKLPPQIRYFGEEGTFVRDELMRGGFRGAYWLVLHFPIDEQGFLSEMKRDNVACPAPVVYHVRGLELRHCRPQTESGRSGQAAGDPAPKI